MKEVGFAFLYSRKSCLEGILSFGKEANKNTKGNNRNKLSRFILEKGSKGSHSKTFPFDFHCFLPLLFLVELLFLSVSFSIAIPSLEWNSDTSYPLAVGSPVAFVGQDDCIYVFGGENSSYDSISNSYKYSTTAGSPKEWTEIVSMPTAVWGAAGCVGNDGRFFIFGGAENNGSYPSFIQIYNAKDNSWNTTTTPNSAIDDHDMSCAVDSSTGLMYITGGNHYGTRFYSYNVSSNTITNLSTSSPTPFSLYAQGSFVNNGKLYVFGGWDDSTEDYSSSTYIYDIANNSWSIGGNMTQAAVYFGYATDGSRFYAIGGNDNNGNLDYTQVYNISSGKWSVNNGIVYSGGINSNAAVFLDGSLHSIGGYDGSYNSLSVHLIATLCGVYTISGPCDDGNRCTTNDTCSNGTCSGTSICTPPNQCQTNVTCNPTTGDCVYTNVSGGSCNDNNQCLLNTTCSNGECTGQSKNCSDSTCDPSTGECVTSSTTTSPTSSTTTSPTSSTTTSPTSSSSTIPTSSTTTFPTSSTTSPTSSSSTIPTSSSSTIPTSSTTTSPTSSSSTIGSTSISSSIIAGFTFGLLIFLD